MNRYVYFRKQEKNYLMHHGIKGQKWGVRRYQNEDGTLTEEGKKRYGIHSSNRYQSLSEQFRLSTQLSDPGTAKTYRDAMYREVERRTSEILDEDWKEYTKRNGGVWDDSYGDILLDHEQSLVKAGKKEVDHIIDLYWGEGTSEKIKKREKGKRIAAAVLSTAIAGATIGGSIAIANAVGKSAEKAGGKK